MKNILITGIRGFIGFNAIQLWKKENPEYNYVGLDANTYADKIFQDKKNKWLDENGIDHFDVELGKYSAYQSSSWRLTHIVEKYNIDTIVHFAAESHVDNSIKNPNAFFEANVLGTVDVLNCAKDHDLRVHVIGTDEVYGETTPDSWIDRCATENSERGYTYYIEPKDKPLVPSSPYSSSKASADMIALSYQHTFGTNVTISRCTNNFGPWQHPEKLIGTTISKALRNEKIPVYGKGNQKRHWIHVDEHNRAVMQILKNGKSGAIYNIGPRHDNWITNIELIKFILKQLNKPETLIEHVTDRLGHDTSYYLHSSTIYESPRNWKDDMVSTISWFKENI